MCDLVREEPSHKPTTLFHTPNYILAEWDQQYNSRYPMTLFISYRNM